MQPTVRHTRSGGAEENDIPFPAQRPMLEIQRLVLHSENPCTWQVRCTMLTVPRAAHERMPREEGWHWMIAEFPNVKNNFSYAAISKNGGVTRPETNCSFKV